FNASRYRCVTLRQFQQVAEIVRAIFLGDSKHVRVNNRFAVQNPRKPKHKTHHPAFIKRAHQDRANFRLRFERERRIHFEILNSPDLSLQSFNLTHLGEALNFANLHQINRPAISSLSQFTSIGFVTYASKPDAFASERKSSSWCAVTAIMGTSLSRSSLRINFVASKPSMSGSVRSIRITSGFSRIAVSTATWPFSASKTMKPCSSSSRRIKRRVSSKSSTRRTLRSLESRFCIDRQLYVSAKRAVKLSQQSVVS